MRTNSGSTSHRSSPIETRSARRNLVTACVAAAELVTIMALALVFYGLITPAAIVLRLFGRDALLLHRRRPGADSYWLPMIDERRPQSYYRQY